MHVKLVKPNIYWHELWGLINGLTLALNVGIQIIHMDLDTFEDINLFKNSY